MAHRVAARSEAVRCRGTVTSPISLAVKGSSLYGVLQQHEFEEEVLMRQHDTSIPSTVEIAVSSGLISVNPGPHINTGESARIFSRNDIRRTMWLADDETVEIVLKDGLEGEGDWIVATATTAGWTVVRDFWNTESDESAEETLVSTETREEAADYLFTRLLR